MKWKTTEYGGLCGIVKEADSDNTLPDGMTVIDHKFYITLPDGITTISYDVFQGCTYLHKIVIPDTVKMIANSAFNDCTALEEVILPEGLKILKNGVFKNCSALKRIVIPGSVEVIDSVAFMDCISLETVVFSGPIHNIRSGAFRNCPSLIKIEFNGIDWDKLCISHRAFDEKTVTDIPELMKFFSENMDGQRIIDSGQCGDNVFWKVTQAKELIVYGTGKMNDYSIGYIAVGSNCSSCCGHDGGTTWTELKPMGTRPPWNGHDIDELIIMNGVTYLGQMAIPAEEHLDIAYLPDSLTAMAKSPLPYVLEIIASDRIKKMLENVEG